MHLRGGCLRPSRKLRFLFDDYTLDTGRRELRRGPTLLHVEPQVFDLLEFLVGNRDRVVSKDDLLASVWGGRIVSESTIASRINAVRRLIGDSGEQQRLLRTIIGKGVRLDVKQIGRELGIRYVLEGSVRRAGDWVRVNVQLTDVESGAHLWADRFDTDRANLAAAQDEITGRIAATLNVELVRDATRRIDQEKAADPNARNLVMRGRAFRFRPATEANRLDALLNFERALEIDPRSLDARIGVASTLVANLADGWSNSPEQDIARAEQLLIDVLETGLYSAWAHVVIGMLRRVQNRLDEAKMECESAIALDRNDAGALFQLGLTLMFLGRPEAATSYIEKALRLNPHDPNAANRLLGIGCVSSLFGRYRSGTRPDQQGSRRKSPALAFSSRSACRRAT